MKKKSWWCTNIPISSKAKSIKALKNNNFTQGKYTHQAEIKISKIFDRPIIFTQNGTNAILISLLALDLKKNDEVLVPNFGWIATLQPLVLMGIKFKLIDVDQKVPNINLKNIKKNITKNTKAIIFVHFHGRMNFVEEISNFCKSNNLFLIEDACKAIGCRKKKLAGTYGNFGCFSTGMISLLNTGYGGFIVINDKKFEKKMRLIKDHGCIRANDTYPYLGLNFKTSDICSSLIIDQCKRKNINLKIKKLKKIYNIYQKLSNYKVKLMKYSDGEVPLCIDIYSKKISLLKRLLKKNNIPFCNLHRPFHESKFIRKNTLKFKFNNSVNFFKNYIMLPSGPDQKISLVKKTVNLINKEF